MKQDLLQKLRAARANRDLGLYGSIVDESLERDISRRDGDDGQDALVKCLQAAQAEFGGTLRLTVLGADGNALPGATVRLGDKQLVTDSQGQAVMYPAVGHV